MLDIRTADIGSRIYLSLPPSSVSCPIRSTDIGSGVYLSLTPLVYVRPILFIWRVPYYM